MSQYSDCSSMPVVVSFVVGVRPVRPAYEYQLWFHGASLERYIIRDLSAPVKFVRDTEPVENP